MSTHIKHLILPLVGFAATVAWADYPAQDIISINISNDASYKMTGNGETETLAGTLPDNAWQNTSNADRTGVWHSGDARNGYRNGVTAWDGASQSVTNLANVVFSWAVAGDGVANFGNYASRTPVFQRAWLARANATGTDGEIVVQNIPYERYDVIVYASGSSSATTIRSIRVNGHPYRWSNSSGAMERSDSSWGNVQNTLEIGKNALRVTGITSPDLHIRMVNATSYGISAVQIVRDMSAGANNGQRAAGKVISVNIQSAKNTSGYTTGDMGLERVPYAAWTQDGLALANSNANYDSDVNVALKEWDGATGETTELSGVTLHEKVKNAYYYAANGYVPQPQVLSGYADDSTDSNWRGTFTVTGVPYKKYDVIVYCATDGENKYFAPVTVNGTPYRWSMEDNETQQASGEESTAETRWGFSRCRAMAYGSNAIRVTNQTASTLTIKGGMNGDPARGCIAAFQIVDTYDAGAVPEITVEDGGTYEIEAALQDAVRIVCDGSLTIVGANGYTVTKADILKLDLDAVTGTATLGANTCYALGADRTLPAGVAFGEGSAVAIAETVEEYAKDEFSVSGLTGVSYVMLTHYDGSTERLTVTDGTASYGDGTVVAVTGVAALYDFTFTNTVHTATGSRKSTSMSVDGGYSADYKTSETDGTGINAWVGPWINMASSLPTWTEFSTVVVGQMPSEAKKMFVSFGSSASGGKMLYLATGTKENEVIVGYTGQSEPVATMTVPNASKARHVYTFVVANGRKDLYIYLDGIFWKKGTSESGFTFGTGSHGGIQVGSGFGGNPSGYSRPAQEDTGVFYSLLIYDYILSDAQIEALKELYPYNSPLGSYAREVSGAETFAGNNCWTKVGESDVTYDVPANGSAVTLTTLTDAEVEVNATLSLESLTLEGDGSLVLNKGEGLLTSAGLTTIATDVTIEAGAVDVSGAPVVITGNGSLCFDYSGFDLSGYAATTLVPLTGEIAEQAEGVVTCIVPEADADRGISAEFVYANGSYQLRVACREALDVYLQAGATAFADDTVVTWTEGEGDEAEEKTGYAMPADTVHFSAADTVSVVRESPVAGYDFGEYDGSLVFAPGEDELVLDAQVAGSGKVVVASGVLQSRGSIATDIDVEEGAKLKLGSVGGFGATNGGVNPSGKTITVRGTVELNGIVDSCNEFTLDGGTLQNNGSAVGTGNRQTTGLTLADDSTVHAGANFGLVASGYGATSIAMNGHTLTKTGPASFWLYTTTISGGGKIVIAEGSVYAYNPVSAANTTFQIDSGAVLKIRTDSFTGGTLLGEGEVSVGQNRPDAPLKFTEGTDLSLSIVIANGTEEVISIPCEHEPKSVSVFESSGNWDTPCEAVKSIEYKDGSVVVKIDVANARRPNPAVDGDGATFVNVFMGNSNPAGAWETPANWKVVSNNRWADYTGSLAPGLTDSNYSSVLFDGDLLDNIAPDAAGYKNVTVSTRLEGWTLKMGLFNHVKVSTVSVKKQQGGCFYMVDATSKLVFGDNNRVGNNGNGVAFYVAAKDGVEFTSNFNFASISPGVEYYLSGKGSVNYTKGITTGAHMIKRVELPANLNTGDRPTKLKTLFTRKLVSFGDTTVNNVTFSFDGAVVVSPDFSTMTAYSGEGDLTTAAAFGTYQFVQKEDGIYLNYVGYAKPFSISIR